MATIVDFETRVSMREVNKRPGVYAREYTRHSTGPDGTPITVHGCVISHGPSRTSVFRTVTPTRTIRGCWRECYAWLQAVEAGTC